MIDLNEALESLHELCELRSRAKELREAACTSLKDIENTAREPNGIVELSDQAKSLRQPWISSGNNVEVGLLVKVQNHRDLSEKDEENDIAEASRALKDRLAQLKIKDLFPPDTNTYTENIATPDHSVPVLVAARAMQALVTRSKTVFSRATMLCYYRIIRELYTAAKPDWTIGAARAGAGGRTSAFVTGECIRAIFAFDDAILRTVTFFKQTHRLVGRYQLLKGMTRTLDDNDPVDSPIKKWIQSSIERMWVDWYIATNPRHRDMALHLGNNKNELLFDTAKQVNMHSVGAYLLGLQKNLMGSVDIAKRSISEAKSEIANYREGTEGRFFEYRKDGSGDRKPKDTEIDQLDEEGKRVYFRRIREYDRHESAHKFAFSLVSKAEAETSKSAETLSTRSRDKELEFLKTILNILIVQFEDISSDIRKVLEPARRYIRNVLNRELAAETFGRFDAGELVFAAASYGAMTDWQSSELITKACGMLIQALPEDGRLLTKRPFQSTLRGHRMIPIGCEMTRSLAQLLQKSGYEFEPKSVRNMLNIFEEKLITLNLRDKTDQKVRIAWNFDGSPNPDRPCVWVTAVSVLAVDRVIRMLNERINSIVFKNFQVIFPEKPHSRLTLNDLVYSDIGFSNYFEGGRPSIGLRLEQMRSHVMRVRLPESHQNEKLKRDRIFSTILYGPPGTGKTTFAEALALSSGRPLLRLSPSDLVVKGHAVIEGQARNVFEALTMLSQTVIILDEFEGVVGQSGSEGHELEIFELLRRGMLPKLVRLYESAKTQSLAYCLATNFLARIDPAAKRKGRFDLCLPVYAPDPLSRAGMLLYRLHRVERKLARHKRLTKQKNDLPRRFLEVVQVTRDIRASSLAEDYFSLPEWENSEAPPPATFKDDIPLLWYISTGEQDCHRTKLAELEEERRKTKDQVGLPDPHTDDERDEYKWLLAHEETLTVKLKTKASLNVQDVYNCLAGPCAEGIKRAEAILSKRRSKPNSSKTSQRRASKN